MDFQMYFLDWKSLNFNSYFPEFCSKEYNLVQTIVGSGNHLALNRWESTTWTNNAPVQWHIYVLRSLSELTSLKELCYVVQSSAGYNVVQNGKVLCK